MTIYSDYDRDAARRLLDLQLTENDADAPTVREYLIALLSTLWAEGEGFSGKRPFGNSGWRYDLYIPMIKVGIVTGVLDEDGYVDTFDTPERNRAYDLIRNAITELGRTS